MVQCFMRMRLLPARAARQLSVLTLELQCRATRVVVTHLMLLLLLRRISLHK